MPQLDNLYIKGLPNGCTEADLLEIFSPFGRVISCKLITGKGASCATAFVRYARPEEAEYALEKCNGTAPQKFYAQMTKMMSDGMEIRFADTPEEKQARTGAAAAAGKGKGKGKGPYAPGPQVHVQPAAAARFEPYPTVSVTAVSPPTQYGGKGLIAPMAVPVHPPQGKGGAGNLGQIVDNERQRHMLDHYEHPSLGTMSLAAKMQGEPDTNLFIRDLPAPFSEYAVYALFSPFGAIVSIKVVRDAQNPQRHKGYGFVRYAYADSAAAAIEAMNGAVLGPGMRPLTVKLKTQEGPVRGAAAQDGSAAGGGVPAAAAPAGGGFIGECTVQLAVPKNRRGQLVGAGAQVFKGLQARHGVALTVPRAQEPEETPTVVTGPSAQVDACIAEIGHLVREPVSVISDSRQQ